MVEILWAVNKSISSPGPDRSKVSDNNHKRSASI
jgi:hypothetical protein